MKQIDKIILQSYIPEKAVDTICDILAPISVKIKIVNPRKHVQGSYQRPKLPSYYHLITINNDLNPYTFLLTFLHEIAHLHAWEKNRSMGHGQDWKLCFMTLIKQFLSLNVFPEDIQCALEKHLQNIKSSEVMDISLAKTLQKYDTNTFSSNHLVILEDVPKNAVFLYDNKKMEKQSLMRKYYLCKDLKTNKLYRCHPLMKVSLV